MAKVVHDRLKSENAESGDKAVETLKAGGGSAGYLFAVERLATDVHK